MAETKRSGVEGDKRVGVDAKGSQSGGRDQEQIKKCSECGGLLDAAFHCKRCGLSFKPDT